MPDIWPNSACFPQSFQSIPSCMGDWDSSLGEGVGWDLISGSSARNRTQSNKSSNSNPFPCTTTTTPTPMAVTTQLNAQQITMWKAKDVASVQEWGKRGGHKWEPPKVGQSGGSRPGTQWFRWEEEPDRTLSRMLSWAGGSGGGGGFGTPKIGNGEICCTENLAPILRYH